SNAPDSAMRQVAARVAEIDLAMLDDRVVPIGDVDRAVGAHLDVDGTKGGVVRLAKLPLLAGCIAGPILADDESAHAMATKIVGDHVPLPVGRQVPAADDLQAAVLRAAGIKAREDANSRLSKDIARARQAV